MLHCSQSENTVPLLALLMGQLLTVTGTTAEKLLIVWNSWCRASLAKDDRVSICGYSEVKLLDRWVLGLPF